MSVEITEGILEQISGLIGTTVPALKLLLTILAGYPLALIHRKFVYNQNANVQHLYFIATGFMLGYWNYGVDFFHCVTAILATYLTLFIFKGSQITVIVTFVLNMTYLLIGYYYSSTEDYDINWTMPYCILVLRLIAVSYDLYDGHQPEEKLSTENKKVMLKEVPNILEMFGHSLFPSSFLIGPQFPMKRYQQFVAGEFYKKDDSDELLPPQSVEAAIKRLLLGVLYLTIFQLLGYFVSDDLMASEEFGNMNFFRKMLLLGMWGRYTLYKYISCWLLTEGACILFGMSYNGETETGEIKWDGVENVKLSVFENTTEFNHYILSFNTNTNHWVAQYIYKRLKFLGNRQLSQLAALLFLAIWHGYHSGYYVCFFFEFMVIYMEREVKSIVKSNETLTTFFQRPDIQLYLKIILRIYTFVFMGWCLLPFGLMSWSRYWSAFSNVDHVGTLLFLLWPIVYAPICRIAFKKRKNKEQTE